MGCFLCRCTVQTSTPTAICGALCSVCKDSNSGLCCDCGPDYPWVPRLINEKRLTMCLREGGVIPDHIKVVSCTVEVVGRGTAKERQDRADDSVGLYSCISRVALQYGHTNDTSDIALSDLNERGENQYPKTLIVKSTPEGISERLLGNLLGFFDIEVQLYKRNVIAGAGIRVPKLYFATHDDTTGARYILIMEDLAPRKSLKQHQGKGGFLIEHAKEVADELTKLHSKFWNCVYTSNLGRSKGGFLIDKSFLLQQALDMYANDLDFSLDWIKNTLKITLSDQTLAYATLLQQNVAGFFSHRLHYATEQGGQTDCTLVHGDPRPENIFLTPLTFIDFQLSMEAPAEHDIMWMTIYGFESEYRRDHELELLFHFHNCLRKRGINTKSHSIEAVAFHYADATGFMLAQQIIAAKVLSKKVKKDPLASKLFVDVLLRLDSFIQDWDISEMLKFNLSRVKQGLTKQPITNSQLRACIPDSIVSKIDSMKSSQPQEEEDLS